MLKWYVLYTISGSEKKVKKRIEELALEKGLQSNFSEIIVPMIEVPEIKKGKKVMVEKKLMSSYILLKMEMTDEAWHLVKSVSGAVGFLGSKTNPHPLTEDEANSMFDQLQVHAKNATDSSLYNLGDKVRVTDGPFESLSGSVEAVDPQKQTVKVSVSIFGKPTPVELGFAQVRKESKE